MGIKRSGIETALNENIENSLNIEKYIGEILNNENFDGLNFLRVSESQRQRTAIEERIINSNEKLENAEFISVDINSLAPYSSLITEREFFAIVGANSKNIYKRSGRYQESLYSNYLEAKRERDEGYIVDVLAKAIVLKNNIEYARSLSQNPKFMKEWRKDFGRITPESEVKNSGTTRKLNIVKSRIE